ncbi:hypothetical protein L345_15340, partial [Ophiophagus hannah]
MTLKKGDRELVPHTTTVTSSPGPCDQHLGACTYDGCGILQSRDRRLRPSIPADFLTSKVGGGEMDLLNDCLIHITTAAICLTILAKRKVAKLGETHITAASLSNGSSAPSCSHLGGKKERRKEGRKQRKKEEGRKEGRPNEKKEEGRRKM